MLIFFRGTCTGRICLWFCLQHGKALFCQTAGLRAYLPFFLPALTHPPPESRGIDTRSTNIADDVPRKKFASRVLGWTDFVIFVKGNSLLPLSLLSYFASGRCYFLPWGLCLCDVHPQPPFIEHNTGARAIFFLLFAHITNPYDADVIKEWHHIVRCQYPSRKLTGVILLLQPFSCLPSASF